VLATVLVVVLAVLVLVPLLAVGRVVQQGSTDDRTPTDAVVVLGAAQFWGRPSPVLEARLTQARELYDDGVAPRIVTVGGKQDGDITTEAQAGRQWLAANGVPARDVTAVRDGSDTLSSLTAVADLMQRRGWTSVTLVTDPAHMARSLAMAQALGMDAHGSPSQTGDGSHLAPEYVVREAGGLLWFWLAERRDVEQVVGG
jgi:uncharacterized SAM-binding protein YcdF (DUF218 family)